MLTQSVISSLLVLLATLISSIHTNSLNCMNIIGCSPEFAAFDTDGPNRTLEIRCTFRKRIEPYDLLWQFPYNNQKRLIVDMDGAVMAPFKHEIINEFHNGEPHSVSILKVPLLNSSYYTTYSCMSLTDSCSKTVKVNLKERALGYMNSSTSTKFNLLSFSLVLLNVLNHL